MSFAYQRRRGTTSSHATFTGLAGELTVDTTKNVVVVHDGTTAGGHPLAQQSVTINAQTASYTPVIGDNNNTLITMSSTSATTITIPPNSSVAFSVGAVLNFVNLNTGTVTFAQGSGVTIVSTGATASAPAIRAQYSTATAIQTSANNWLVLGDIA
jgi:hypothetical protein